MVVLDMKPLISITAPSKKVLDLGATIEFERIAVTAFKTSPEPERVVESGTLAQVKILLSRPTIVHLSH